MNCDNRIMNLIKRLRYLVISPVGLVQLSNPGAYGAEAAITVALLGTGTPILNINPLRIDSSEASGVRDSGAIHAVGIEIERAPL